MQERTSDNENIEREEEEWLQKNDSSNKIFLRAVAKEMVEKCADDSINTKRLTIFLRNIYAREARLHPLLTQSLSVFGNFVLPKAIFIPPSQIVMLVAEYDADITFEELLRRLAKSGIVKKKERRMLYADNLLLGTVSQKAVHMSNLLFELGRNIVSNSLTTVGKMTDLVQLECHLCHFKTESRIVLETHKEIPHYIRRRYRCSFCTEFFANILEIKSHFLEKHDVIARGDYRSTTLECPSCTVICNNEFSLRKHKKFCCFVKTGFTMFSTRKQALCAINEDLWDAKSNCDLLYRDFEQYFMEENCGVIFHVALLRLRAKEHPRRINLMDVRSYPNTSCFSGHLTELENGAT
uniref:C2H2-type domain-containing protein n=1 Tax=Setaria digitata TaxID=48799 RepID=A0A915PY60_9BILA